MNLEIRGQLAQCPPPDAFKFHKGLVDS